MVDITRLAAELQRRTEWQHTPDALFAEDYHAMVVSALRNLYVLTGRATLYNEEKLVYEEGLPVLYDASLQVDEEEYVLLTAEIDLFRKVQTEVNNAFGYSTDALTITNADRPYANLSTTVNELENRRRVLYYKMTRFNLL